MPPAIILASLSSTRQEMLRAAGVRFIAKGSKVDETALKSTLMTKGADPREIAKELAVAKARYVSGRNPGAFVIGADQVLECDGCLLSKPVDLDDARAQLCQLRGRQHSLISAVVVCRDDRPLWHHLGETRLWMRDFSDSFLDGYLSAQGDDLLATVGGYKLESHGVRLFSRIKGDYFTVLGMPLVELLNFMAETGILEQ